MTEDNTEQQDRIKKGTLSRYTKWSYFLEWLEKSAILIGDYAEWEDKSDVAILDAYVERNKNIPIRVLCLFNSAGYFNDSYYHWKVYTDKNDGIRIDFNKDKLLKALGNMAIFKKVKYPATTAKALEKAYKSIGDLPFVKRASYESDEEFRLIFSGDKDTMKKGQLFEFKVKKDFFKDSIDGIRLGYSMSEEKFVEIKNILKKYGIEKNVCRSRIIKYERWENKVLKFVDSKNSNRGN